MSSTLPLTYADLVCLDDMDATGLETTSDLQNLKQDLLHVLWETIGSNPDDPDRGVGIPGLLSASLTDFTKATNLIDAQFEKDDRVSSSTTTVTFSLGMYLIETDVVVSGAVVGLAWSYGPEGLKSAS